VKMQVRGLSPKLDLAELGASRTVRAISSPHQRIVSCSGLCR
jgi:hypothetical protein